MLPYERALKNCIRSGCQKSPCILFGATCRENKQCWRNSSLTVPPTFDCLASPCLGTHKRYMSARGTITPHCQWYSMHLKCAASASSAGAFIIITSLFLVCAIISSSAIDKAKAFLNNLSMFLFMFLENYTTFTFLKGTNFCSNTGQSLKQS